MGKYDILAKYIERFIDDEIGEWFIDRENDVIIEQPIQMPHVKYSREVSNFIHDVHFCAKEVGVNNYVEILK